MSDIIEISKALHALLSANSAVQAVLGLPPRLYDNPPDDPIFPYLTYGPMRSEDISADGAVISAHTLTLHIWSRYGAGAGHGGFSGCNRGAAKRRYKFAAS